MSLMQKLFLPKGEKMRRLPLERGPQIVVLGGGTGLSVLLRGLKRYTSNITAIVSVADDGGSSGRLRGEYGILPPGDLRNCMVALSSTENVMEKVFNYRFNKGELAGHNLGNILITALADITGSFENAIREVSSVLAIQGKVLPSTLENIVLEADLEDGSKVRGETNISQTRQRILRVRMIPENPRPLNEAIQAIREAEAIVLGPGSLFTSVIPNLLVPGIVEAIHRSAALKIYVCNIMTQPGETRGYSANDHLQAILGHSLPDLVQIMLVNDSLIPADQMEKYLREGTEMVYVDKDKILGSSVELISGELYQDRGYIRHDPEKLSRMIIECLYTNPKDRLR